MQTNAGLEIGVASTKAFTTQLAVLRALTLLAATDSGSRSEAEVRSELHDLGQVTGDLSMALGAE